MKNPNDKYYQIPTPKGVISKSQYIPNPKTKEEKIYDIRERVFSFAQRVLEIAEIINILSAIINKTKRE